MVDALEAAPFELEHDVSASLCGNDVTLAFATRAEALAAFEWLHEHVGAPLAARVDDGASRRFSRRTPA